MNDLQPEAGPSRRVYTPSPSLSPPPSPSPPRRRKRHMSESEEDEYNPFMPSPRLYGGGKPRRQPPRRNNAPRPPDSTAPRKRVTRARARRNSSPSITASLESIASEDASVKREVQRLNLGLRDVQGDGNCLFRALADQLWGVQKRHVEVRKLVCDHLEMYKETMRTFVQPFLPGGETYDEYVLRMRQSKQFGSHIEIQAAARVFKRDIRVVMSTTSFTIPWENEFPSHQHAAQPSDTDEGQSDRPRRRTRSTTTSLLSTPAAPPPTSPLYATNLADYIPAIRDGRSMLWLALFSLAEHFQSIRRKGDGDSGPAEVEDRLAIPHEKDVSEAARRERGEIPNKDVPSAKVSEVLASLPPGHGVSNRRVEEILARTKGDLGDAVDILLEEIEDLGVMSDSSTDPAFDTPATMAYREGSGDISSSQSDYDSSKTSETTKLTTPNDSGDETAHVADGLDELQSVYIGSEEKGIPVITRRRRIAVINP